MRAKETSGRDAKRETARGTKSSAAVAAATAKSAEAGPQVSAAGKPPASSLSDVRPPSAKTPENKFVDNKYAKARRFPRFVLDVRLQVRMFQNGDFQTCWGRSTEIGQDGIGATLTGSLSTGEIVTLEIPLPLTPYPMKVRAIVRFCQGLRYGFEFLTMNDSQRDTVRRVCDYLASRT